MEQIIKFDNVKLLYDDMAKHNQSFTKSENESVGSKSIVEGGTIYRLVKLRKGHLEFNSNKFGGSDLRISGNIQYAEKIGNLGFDGFSEYRLIIEGRQEPLILLACKKRRAC